MPDPKPQNGFLAQSFQTVPSVLLNDLARRDARGKPMLEHIDIVVYALLKAYAWQKASCWPGYENLARKASCSPSTIQRSLKRLEAANHILRKSNTVTGTIFILTDIVDGKVIRRRIEPTSRRNPFAAQPPCTTTITQPAEPAAPTLTQSPVTLPTSSRTLYPVPTEETATVDEYEGEPPV